MIRLRIERMDLASTVPVVHESLTGIVWYENGCPVGLVIIEQSSQVNGWTPVEVEDRGES